MQPDPNYDFNPSIEKTTVELAKDILNEMNARAEGLIFPISDKATPEEQRQRNIDFADFVTDVTKKIAVSDIPMDYVTYPLERLIATLSIVKTKISGKTREVEDELLSRFYGVRSPKTGRYARDCATFATVLTKLKQVQEETGNLDSDYHDTPEAPVEGAVASPFMEPQ